MVSFALSWLEGNASNKYWIDLGSLIKATRNSKASSWRMLLNLSTKSVMSHGINQGNHSRTARRQRNDTGKSLYTLLCALQSAPRSLGATHPGMAQQQSKQYIDDFTTTLQKHPCP